MKRKRNYTAYAVLVDVCNIFFSWSKSAIFPATRWQYYISKVDWLQCAEPEFGEKGGTLPPSFSLFFSLSFPSLNPSLTPSSCSQMGSFSDVLAPCCSSKAQYDLLSTLHQKASFSPSACVSASAWANAWTGSFNTPFCEEVRHGISVTCTGFTIQTKRWKWKPNGITKAPSPLGFRALF